MSTAWVVAAGVLTVLVVALSVALVAVMSRLSELEAKVSRQQRQLTTLRSAGSPPRPSAPPPPPAASVVVLLESTRATDLALVDDIRGSGGLSVDVPTTVYVTDDDEGRSLVEGLAVDVAPFYRDRSLSDDFPSVVVLDADGGVLATGSPSTVADLESLVRPRRAAHVH